MKTKDLLCVAVLLSVFIVSSTMANDVMDPRREQLLQEAHASFAEIDQSLTAILEKANFNQRPDAAKIQRAAELLETNRRNAVIYDSRKKAAYMLLQSWVSYYQSEPVNNLNWAVRANREDPANGDAWISQTLFSLAYGRRPVEPQAPRQQPNRQPNTRRPQPQPRGRQAGVPADMAPASGSNPPFGHPGTLKFDLTMLRHDFFRERFVRQEYTTIDNRKIVYVPETDVLCILFWQAAESRDPNVPGAQPAQYTLNEMDMGLSAGHGAPATGYSLENQQAYFEVMQDVLADKKEVKFVEMNVNSAAVSPDAVGSYRPVAPLVIAALPRSGAMPFVQLDVPTPFMAIIDKGGQVKYAGVADGFMPAFILSHITGVEIDLSDFQAAPSPAYPPAYPMGTMHEGMPDMMMFDSVPPIADPNQTRSAPGTSATAPQTFRELPEHQQLEAEKRLAFARDFFMEAPRKRFITYKRGVDMCRDIIRDFPNTEYAEQARGLLRQVPERHWATYNITSAEVGQ